MTKKFLLLAGLLSLLMATPAFSTTVYDNFTGYTDYWHPFGYPDSATYGQTFTAPTNGDNLLQSIGFYMGSADAPGDIILSAYVATWNGSYADTLLYTSPEVDYANTGDAELIFGGIDATLTPGASYVAFLSVSQYYGQSSGQAHVISGDTSIPGGGFAYSNNGGSFDLLFNYPWNQAGLTPNWAITATFSGSPVPEPSTMLLLGFGLVGLAGVARKRIKA